MFVTGVEHPIGSLISTTGAFRFPGRAPRSLHRVTHASFSRSFFPFRVSLLCVYYCCRLYSGVVTNGTPSRWCCGTSVFIGSRVTFLHCRMQHVGVQGFRVFDSVCRHELDWHSVVFFFSVSASSTVWYICVFVCHVYCRYCYIGNKLIEFRIYIETEFGRRCQIFFIEKYFYYFRS